MNKTKEILKAKGWSYRKVALVLNRRYEYINIVANGHYKSKRLEKCVEQLQPYDDFLICNPNFFNNKPTRKGKNNEQ